MSFLKIITPKNRVFGLDILRAIAICLVVHQHGSGILPNRTPVILYLRNLDGVSIFFVLSGFLIGGIIFRLLSKHNATPTLLLNFWQRRWLRTLPLYFILLAAIIPIYALSGINIPYHRLPEYLIFIQNFTQGPDAFFGVAWSLSVEEWFYLLIPLGLFLLTGYRRRSLAFTSLTFILAVVVLSVLIRHFVFEDYNGISNDDWAMGFRMQVITRIDTIQVGVLGAWLHHYKPNLWLKKPVLFLIIGTTFLIGSFLAKTFNWVDWNGYYMCVLYFLFESIAILAIFPFFLSIEHKEGLFYKLITTLSLVSYSLYLIHVTIVANLFIYPVDWYEIIPVRNLNIVVKYVMYWAISLFLSILSYKYIELPFMRMRPKSPSK